MFFPSWGRIPINYLTRFKHITTNRQTYHDLPWHSTQDRSTDYHPPSVHILRPLPTFSRMACRGYMFHLPARCHKVDQGQSKVPWEYPSILDVSGDWGYEEYGGGGEVVIWAGNFLYANYFQVIRKGSIWSIISLQCFTVPSAQQSFEKYIWFCMFVTDPARLSRIRSRSECIGNFEYLTPNSHGTSGIRWDAHADHCLAWWATSLSAGDHRPCWM